MLFKAATIIVTALWTGSIALSRDSHRSVKDCDVLPWFAPCVLRAWIR
ncbi:hypothetical protein HMPREF9564_00130 [Cutibacterium acnes HL053PA1]|nr:hypothetical protein HMPREF9580_01834 [Cutibacterium acnes HL087PA2]EFS59275.1 hypothetical protein HMPREF9604_00885 [Cutibacterium acnes HL036PA1]EFS62209.1 hypothetical protein HMPREF9605_00064 [Cutibacterium acnes HL036PA2]EFS66872.1 hypothetical protein HMPREF9612_00773 [Cutibacterium acnes HL063PA2]EFS69985.1 hypothetical protein HMPREF9616_00142 [Cutibacterium acnes HL007PA1]EFS70446.1 hypothetical protein HMPREF9617_02151 [Cutibacterium acnes HL056PA1]EFS90055.1 hypothetical protein